MTNSAAPSPQSLERRLMRKPSSYKTYAPRKSKFLRLALCQRRSREHRPDDEQHIRRTLRQSPHVPAIPRRSVTDQRLHDVSLVDEPALRGVSYPVQHVDLIRALANT